MSVSDPMNPKLPNLTHQSFFVDQIYIIISADKRWMEIKILISVAQGQKIQISKDWGGETII